MDKKIEKAVNPAALRDREAIVLKYLSEFEIPISANKISVGNAFPTNQAIGITLHRLSLLGLVERTGCQHCSECGKPSVVWKITDAGKELVEDKFFEQHLGAAICREIVYKEK